MGHMFAPGVTVTRSPNLFVVSGPLPVIYQHLFGPPPGEADVLRDLLRQALTRRAKHRALVLSGFVTGQFATDALHWAERDRMTARGIINQLRRMKGEQA